MTIHRMQNNLSRPHFVVIHLFGSDGFSSFLLFCICVVIEESKQDAEKWLRDLATNKGRDSSSICIFGH